MCFACLLYFFCLFNYYIMFFFNCFSFYRICLVLVISFLYNPFQICLFSYYTVFLVLLFIFLRYVCLVICFVSFVSLVTFKKQIIQVFLIRYVHNVLGESDCYLQVQRSLPLRNNVSGRVVGGARKSNMEGTERMMSPPSGFKELKDSSFSAMFSIADICERQRKVLLPHCEVFKDTHSHCVIDLSHLLMWSCILPQMCRAKC